MKLSLECRFRASPNDYIMPHHRWRSIERHVEGKVMQTAIYTATDYHMAPAAATRIWVGRSTSAFAALFLLLDGIV
jgi:hypothetical protein